MAAKGPGRSRREVGHARKVNLGFAGGCTNYELEVVEVPWLLRIFTLRLQRAVVSTSASSTPLIPKKRICVRHGEHHGKPRFGVDQKYKILRPQRWGAAMIALENTGYLPRDE